MTKYKKMVFKILGVKILDFRNFGYSEKNPSDYNFDMQGKMKKMPAPVCHNLLRNDQNELLSKIQNC